MGPIGCPETSVRNCHYSLRHNPEERGSQVFHPFQCYTLEILIRNSWCACKEYFSLIAPTAWQASCHLETVKVIYLRHYKKQSGSQGVNEPAETLSYQTVHAVSCNNATGMLYLILGNQENSETSKLCIRHCNVVLRTDEADETDEKARFTMTRRL